MQRRADLRRVARGLRFQLTASYALFFAVMLIAFTGFFGERLRKTLNEQSQELLNGAWATMKGYLHIDRLTYSAPFKAYWNYDPDDLDEFEPAYRIHAPYSVWKGLLLGSVDPVEAILKRRLRVDGDVQPILERMRYKDIAARVLARLETRFADE